MKPVRLPVTFTALKAAARGDRAWLLAIFAVGVLLRLYKLKEFGLWHDEGITYLMSQLRWPELFVLLKKHVLAPPLYYYVAKMPLWLFPNELWVIRIPSMVASSATILLLYIWMRRRIGSSRVALTAAGLFALSPGAILFAQEGRNYACLTFLYVAALYAADRFRGKAEVKYLILYALSTLSLLYLHSNGIFLWLSLNLYFFVGQGFQKITQSYRICLYWIVAQTIVLLAFLPWLPMLMGQRELLKESATFQSVWAGNTWSSAILNSLRNLIPGDVGPRSLVPIPAAGPWSWILSAGVCCLLALTKRLQKPKIYLSLISAILLPLLIPALYSQWISPAYVIGKSEAPVLPVFCALLAIALGEIQRPALFLGSCMVLCSAALLSLASYYFSPHYPQKKWDRLTVSTLLTADIPELIILDVEARVSIAAYLKASGTTAPIVLFPDPAGPGDLQWSSHFYPLQRQGDARPETVAKSLEALEQFLQKQNPRAVTLVTTGDLRSETLKYFPHVQSLNQFLKTHGYSAAHAPNVYPMDWQREGYHVLLAYRKAP